MEGYQRCPICQTLIARGAEFSLETHVEVCAAVSEVQQPALTDAELARRLDEEQQGEAAARRLEREEQQEREQRERRARELLEKEAADARAAQELRRQEELDLEFARRLHLDYEAELNLVEARRVQEELNKQAEKEEAERKKAASKTEQIIIQYPQYWTPQDQDHVLVDVTQGSDEWRSVSNLFVNTFNGVCTVAKIERNQNKPLWRAYFQQRERVAAKNNGHPNERQLFHGSRANAYDMIAKEGFDHRVALMTGAYGAGTYFAAASTTSHQYVQGDPKKMFLCLVTAGSVGAGKAGLRLPEEKSPGVRHDSVGTHAVITIFHNDQAYPEYVIHYS